MTTIRVLMQIARATGRSSAVAAHQYAAISRPLQPVRDALRSRLGHAESGRLRPCRQHVRLSGITAITARMIVREQLDGVRCPWQRPLCMVQKPHRPRQRDRCTTSLVIALHRVRLQVTRRPGPRRRPQLPLWRIALPWRRDLMGSQSRSTSARMTPESSAHAPNRPTAFTSPLPRRGLETRTAFLSSRRLRRTWRHEGIRHASV